MGPVVRELVRDLHRDVRDGDSHVLDIQETPGAAEQKTGGGRGSAWGEERWVPVHAVNVVADLAITIFVMQRLLRSYKPAVDTFSPAPP